MNEQIKDLALQAGFPPHWTTDDDYLIEKWEKFAALVAAHEREECAKISDDVFGYDRFVNQFISKRIRARGMI
jgi:hypothetical protein